MQVQTGIRPQSLKAQARSVKLEAEPAVASDLSRVSWATITHRRRLARMNRELMRFLKESAQAAE